MIDPMLPADDDDPEPWGDGGREEADDDAGISEKIDWTELQDFFFEHLASQIPVMAGLLAKEDAAGLARIGHGLKGSGGGVRLPRFTDLGKALEDGCRRGDLAGARAACRDILEEFARHRPELAAPFRHDFEG